MGFLKYVIVFMALFASAWAASTTWGIRNSTNVLLMNQDVFRTPVAFTFTQVNVDFPASGQTNTRIITAIIVTDRFTNSSGATNSLWSGGIGQRFATINLRSQYGQGINSNVQIYGA